MSKLRFELIEVSVRDGKTVERRVGEARFESAESGEIDAALAKGVTALDRTESGSVQAIANAYATVGAISDAPERPVFHHKLLTTSRGLRQIAATWKEIFGSECTLHGVC